MAALHETARHLRVACAGLINYLEELNSRCVTCLRSVYNMLGRPQCCRSLERLTPCRPCLCTRSGTFVSWHFRCVDGMTLRVALEQSLRCPLLGAAGPRRLVRPPRIAPSVRRAARVDPALAGQAAAPVDEADMADEPEDDQHSRKW